MNLFLQWCCGSPRFHDAAATNDRGQPRKIVAASSCGGDPRELRVAGFLDQSHDRGHYLLMIVSKSKLKARMLEIFRTVEQSGESVIVTDRGRPTLKITRLPQRESVEQVFGPHQGAVAYQEDILLPTSDEWPEN